MREVLPRKMIFDDLFDNLEPIKYLDKIMKCDIYEREGNYVLEIDIPRFQKEEIKIEYEQGYLKVIAEKRENALDDKEETKYLRRERTSISKCQRQFYIGNVSEDEIKANFKNGVLTVLVPKKENDKETKKNILIED